MRKLTLFFAFRSPYSALATELLQQAHAQGALDGVDLELVPMARRTQGRFADPTANPEKVAYIIADVARLYAAQNLPVAIPDPFDIDFVPVNKAFLAAEAAGHALGFARAASLLRWSEGQDLAMPETVAEAARRAGWQADAAVAAMTDPAWDAAWESKIDLSERHKVFGVPFYLVEQADGRGEAFWGQDRWPMVLAALSA